MTTLAYERLRQVVEYDPNTGVFTRLVANRRWRAGEAVGSKLPSGYVILKIDGVKHYAHRLAWLYMTEKWPCGDVDHIDGHKDNNRFANLRDVSHSANLLNLQGPNCNNTSGFLGVSKCGDNWAAFLAGRYLGIRDTPESAYQLYLEAKQSL